MMKKDQTNVPLFPDMCHSWINVLWGRYPRVKERIGKEREGKQWNVWKQDENSSEQVLSNKDVFQGEDKHTYKQKDISRLFSRFDRSFPPFLQLSENLVVVAQFPRLKMCHRSMIGRMDGQTLLYRWVDASKD